MAILYVCKLGFRIAIETIKKGGKDTIQTLADLVSVEILLSTRYTENFIMIASIVYQQ